MQSKKSKFAYPTMLSQKFVAFCTIICCCLGGLLSSPFAFVKGNVRGRSAPAVCVLLFHTFPVSDGKFLILV
jgi:hypothetical protein